MTLLRNNLNTFEQQIVEFINIIRKNSKRPDIDSIFKIISFNSALIFTKTDLEEKLKLLLTGRKIENRPTKQGLDLFFVLEDSLHTGIQIIERSVEEQHPTNNLERKI